MKKQIVYSLFMKFADERQKVIQLIELIEMYHTEVP